MNMSKAMPEGQEPEHQVIPEPIAEPIPGPIPEPLTEREQVRMRRWRIAKWVKAAKRFGYYALLLAMVSFGVALVTGFEGFWVTLCVVSLLVAVVVLPIPIIIWYGIRAAEREDRAEV